MRVICELIQQDLRDRDDSHALMLMQYFLISLAFPNHANSVYIAFLM